MGGVIFDLDMTLIDTSPAESFRSRGRWPDVYASISKFIVYPGIIDALTLLRDNNIPTAVVTSSPSIYCNKVLTHWNIPVIHKVCYHDTKNRKPHPDPILKAITYLGADPSKIYSFGDRDIDIVSSKAAGTIACACLWGSPNTAALIKSGPDHIIKNSDDLPTFLMSSML